MRIKRAYLVINPRSGHNVTRISHLVAIFSAADWKVDIALKTYAGQAMDLATRAAKKGYDLIIAYGGDGTINSVVNSVKHMKASSIVGVIPGGTANEWAAEINLPTDPVQAALVLINSDARSIDLGHLEIQGLISPSAAQSNNGQQPAPPATGRKAHKRQAKLGPRVRQRFLLMAGLGVDTQIMPYVSRSLKHQTGSQAFESAAAKRLSTLQSFPAEVWEIDDAGIATLLWQGQAWQLLIANTRLYGSVVDVAPEASIDDGKLDVCVITAGDLFSTIGQITSLLLRRKPDETSAQFFQGKHFVIRAPTSLGLHLDGSYVKLKDYLDKAECELLQHAEGAEQLIVEYRFNAERHALQIAIPRTYDNSLFQTSTAQDQAQAVSQQQDLLSEERPPDASEQISAIQEHGRQVTVIGVAPKPGKQATCIIAGTAHDPKSKDDIPVAVVVDDTALILRQTGIYTSPTTLQTLQAGSVIFVEGKKSRQGVIRATRMVI